MSTTGPVLVLGATGNQGGAVARHLIADGVPVRAATRNPSSPAARELAAAGAALVGVDLDDPDGLAAAMRDTPAVFSVQTFMQPGGTAAETRQGVNVAEAAARAGVGHLVYSSVGGAERGSGVPHFESKWAVEQRIAALGVPATVLRPVLFMENFADPVFGSRLLSFLASRVRPEKPVQLIAVDDIAVVAAAALADPEDWRGRALEIAGDALTWPQIRQALASSAAVGADLPAAETPGGVPADTGGGPEDGPGDMGEEMNTMIDWFDRSGYQADIPRLRARFPQLLTFDAWLARTAPEQAR